MVVSGSCHYVKDRSSYTTYREVTGTAQGMPVMGIGSVELHVQRGITDTSTHTMVLHHVLHIPSASCNGFNPRLTRCMHSWGGDDGVDSEGFDASGRPIWYATVFRGLGRLVLAGNPQGKSILGKGNPGPLWLSIYLTEQEHAQLL